MVPNSSRRSESERFYSGAFRYRCPVRTIVLIATGGIRIERGWFRSAPSSESRRRQDMDPLTPGVTILVVENRFGPLVEKDISMVIATTAPAKPAI